MEKTVFMKIIDRELPAHIVYEDDDTLAFLDIGPVAEGHTLVIPKKPFKNIFDIDDETLAAIMRTVRKIAPVVRDSVGAKGVHINSNHGEEAGQEVPHIHFHIIPRKDRTEFQFWQSKEEPGDLARLAEAIRAKL
ncbi:MAG TPA: HIT family protein [Candidatus Paceibacterota bacterium]|jgi:histidine triad (HIT) family protein